MLPVAAKQSTDPVQLHPVNMSLAMKHAVLAVCHPQAWSQYERNGNASELYLAGVSGFVAVENVDIDREIVSLLCPHKVICQAEFCFRVTSLGWNRWILQQPI